MHGARSRGQRLRLLAILPIERQGPWLDACLLCGDGRDLEIVQVASPQQAAAALRQQPADLLVFWQEGRRHAVLDAWRQLSQLTGHSGFVALGMQVEEGWNEPLLQAGAIACVDMDQTDPLSLVHALRNAAELESLRLQRQTWEQDRERRQRREAGEIDRALSSQRLLLERLDQFGTGPLPLAEEDVHAPRGLDIPSGESDPLANEEGQQYLTALQNFIFDESSAASAAVVHLAEQFALRSATSSSIMRLHLAAVTRVTAGGGSGSLRHCLAGADRFLMELLMRMVDCPAALGGHALGGHPLGGNHAPVERMRLHSPTSPLAAA